jgi:hypothetical protein
MAQRGETFADDPASGDDAAIAADGAREIHTQRATHALQHNVPRHQPNAPLMRRHAGVRRFGRSVFAEPLVLDCVPRVEREGCRVLDRAFASASCKN